MDDRKRGTLIGLAVGALGAAVEFKRPGSFTPVTGYRSGGPHGLNAGEWTHDTSMALSDGLQLVASVGVAPKFLAKVASDLEKPDGFVVVNPERIQYCEGGGRID